MKLTAPAKTWLDSPIQKKTVVLKRKREDEKREENVVLYQTRKTVFDHISKHREESWKYDA